MLAKKIALEFSIAIVFPLLVYSGVSTFSPPPDWQDYQIENFDERHQRASVAEQKQLEAQRVEKQDQVKEHFERFRRHLFYVAIPLGIIAILIGVLLKSQAVGTGLIFGGALSIISGYWVFWDGLTAVLRFISLLIALVVLIVVGYKKLDRQ